MGQRSGKDRVDQLLFKQGLAPSREFAKRLIMEGRVRLADGRRVEKPGQSLPVGTLFSVREPEPYVSRGAYKLLTILEASELDVHGFVCLDAGASTGGFTDCLLQRGASRVYAFDVGHNQLHEKLRADPRVIAREGVNLRDPDPALIPEPLDFICADVSFISLTLIMKPCSRWLKESGIFCVLIKPQFELGPGRTDRGVVRESAAQREACDIVVSFCRDELSLRCDMLVPSAIKGPKGNQEYLALFRRDIRP